MKVITTSVLVIVVFGLAACVGDGDGGGMTPGNGQDTLPKRGDTTTDPTIVSATARCQGSGGPTDPMHIEVTLQASDAMGVANLLSCAGTLDDQTDQGSFGSGANCYLVFQRTCTVGPQIVVGMTVSNNAAGITTASVKLSVSD